MTDPILAAHVDALAGDFNRAKASVALARELLSSLSVPEDLQRRVDTAVDVELAEYRRELGTIRDRLENGSEEELQTAWAEFAGLQQAGRALFSGCLEFLGGLAFRDDRADRGEEEDEKVWRVADRLVVDSAIDCFGYRQPFLTVPAADEALCDSVASTIRVRFPEWTVWSLPLTAYEFGHVALIGDPLNRHFEEVLCALPGEADRSVRPRRWRFSPTSPEHRLRVLLADAFAACHLGLAYGAAAVHLRFDPSAAHVGVPTFDERAKVVIAALRALANSRYVEPDALTRHVDVLERQWDDAVRRAAPVAAAGNGPAPPLEEVLARVTAGMQEAMVEAMVFGQPRWELARSIFVDWGQALRDGAELSQRAPDGARIADVLNAAWVARLSPAAAAGPGSLSSAERERQVGRSALGMALDCLDPADEGRAARRPGALSARDVIAGGGT